MALTTQAPTVPIADPKPSWYDFGVCADAKYPGVCNICDRSNQAEYRAALSAWVQRENARNKDKRIAELEQKIAQRDRDYADDTKRLNRLSQENAALTAQIKELEASLQKLQSKKPAKVSDLHSGASAEYPGTRFVLEQSEDSRSDNTYLVPLEWLRQNTGTSPRATQLQADLDAAEGVLAQIVSRADRYLKTPYSQASEWFTACDTVADVKRIAKAALNK